MHFLRYNLSLIFFPHTRHKNELDKGNHERNAITNVPVYCIASKITLLQWRITNVDPPGIMFVEFFCEKRLLAMDKYFFFNQVCCKGQAGTIKTEKVATISPYKKKKRAVMVTPARIVCW